MGFVIVWLSGLLGGLLVWYFVYLDYVCWLFCLYVVVRLSLGILLIFVFLIVRAFTIA